VTDDLDLAFAPATQQARLIREGEVSSRELVEVYLARIERLDDQLGSYVEVLSERARADAASADDRTVSDEELGLLHGVPVSIKDLHFLAGARLTMGTRSWAEFVAPIDEYSVARLLVAGAVPLGKTNVPEFGTIAHTETSLLGGCATPWDTTRNAGGSSGGAGAALAAGLCALSQGSDGGGSIRIPAAINGLVGLKPARDRISNGPVLGEIGFGLATSGALTRTVADAALTLDVMAGYEAGDPGIAPVPPRSWTAELGAPVGQLRVGISRLTPFAPEGLHPSVEAALDATVGHLEALGHEVVEFEFPVPEETADHVLTMWAASLASQPFDPSTYEPVNAWLYEVGQRRSAAALAAAQFQLQLLTRSLIGATAHLDAVALPVLTGPSRPNGHYDGWEGEAVFRDQTAFVGMTPVANITGQPAISLPLHHDDEVGPVGVQFIGRPWDEAGLLCLAAQLEEAAPWHDRLPALAR
jgi:Asp-tRNA(Asn)/Glu-tRNA(Gln) amidotransferase A subunit family amidase